MQTNHKFDLKFYYLFAFFYIYYINAYGGWDAIGFNATAKEKETSKLSTFTNNNVKKLYNMTLNKKWDLNSPVLNDEQSENFASNLLSSPIMYLHNLNTGEITQVLVTNTSIEHLTRRNNGKKRITYKLTVEEARTRLRY